MGLRERFSQVVFFSIILFPVIIILSGFLGLFWLNSYFILVASAIISFMLFSRLYSAEFIIPPRVVLLSLLLLVLLSHPVLLITPFFPASADAVVTTATTLLFLPCIL